MSEKIAPCQRMPARWQRRKQARTGEILDAAAQVLAEKSDGTIRMADIAERAGITKGTIYLYFADKDAVIRAITERLHAADPQIQAAE